VVDKLFHKTMQKLSAKLSKGGPESTTSPDINPWLY